MFAASPVSMELAIGRLSELVSDDVAVAFRFSRSAPNQDVQQELPSHLALKQQSRRRTGLNKPIPP